MTTTSTATASTATATEKKKKMKEKENEKKKKKRMEKKKGEGDEEEEEEEQVLLRSDWVALFEVVAHVVLAHALFDVRLAPFHAILAMPHGYCNYAPLLLLPPPRSNSMDSEI